MRVGISCLISAVSAFSVTAQAQETPEDIIAAHVRLQGYECVSPKSAKRDVRASRPDAAVWLIKCENARYRVRLTPDMADAIAPY